MAQALGRARRTAADLIEDRIELWRLELRETSERAGRAIAYLALAGLFGGVSWIGMCAATAFALARITSPALALGAVAFVNAGLAALLVLAGRRALRSEEDSRA